jgi:hypothetical protein
MRAGMASSLQAMVSSVEWVKAHVMDRMSAEAIDLMEPLEKWKAISNGAADKEAKEALGCHPEFPDDMVKVIERELNHVQLSMQVISAVLRLWPRLPRGMLRLPTGDKVGRRPNPRVPDGHSWKEPSKGWVRCSRCWASRKEGSSKVLNGDGAQCLGRPMLLDQLAPGHDIWLYPCGSDNIVVCRKCGFWGTRKFVELKKPCGRGKGLPVGRRRVLDRVSQHLHPSDSKELKRLPLEQGHRLSY